MSRIALIGKNSVEFIRNLLNIWNSGNCAVLIDWRIPFDTAVKMMCEAKVTTCYVENNIYDEDTASGIELIVYERKFVHAELLPEGIYDGYKENYSGNEAVVIYSSGTTGNSKGIILSHYAINTNADAIIDYMNPEPTDVFAIIKSLSHSSTLVGELLVALKRHIPILVFSEHHLPSYIFKVCRQYLVTTMFLNPNLLAIYSRKVEFTKSKKANTLKYIYVSGSILTESVLNSAYKAFPDVAIYNVYGLTEAGPRVAAQTRVARSNNSVGRPISGVEVKVVNERGQKQDIGQVGSVFVKTHSCFSGYISDGQMGATQIGEWLDTGDCGYLNCNKELFIVGRNDTCILFQSHKIFPEEVETTLLELGAFTECLVSICGDDLTCFYSTDALGPIDETAMNQVLQHCKKLLPPYEIPNRFVFTTKLKRNNNGKLIRGEFGYE
ncbi:MAG: acyl--CoA ligase [Alphaproteobacteria bacterium]|nr:acyl--CoA ligase [Alphaproteobacteria bacterium]